MTKAIKVCARILAEARRTGGITNKRAAVISGVQQPWHYLETMRKEGLLWRKAGRWLAMPPALAADYDRLLDELCSLSNNIQPQKGDMAPSAIRQEIDMLVYSFDPDPPLNVRE